MNKIIQASEAEFLDLVRQAIRLELETFRPSEAKDSRQPAGTKSEIATYLKISKTKLDTMTKSGELKSFKIGNQVRYKWDDIEKYLQSKG